MHPASDVVRLCRNAPTPSDRHASAIAEFLGARVSTIVLDDGDVTAGVPAAPDGSRAECLIVSADTLAALADTAPSDGRAMIDAVARLATHAIVYGFASGARHEAVLRALTGGRLRGIEPVPGSPGRFEAAGTRRWLGPFAGLAFGEADAERDCRFVESDERSGLETLIRVPGGPFFVRAADARSSTEIFLIGCRDVADLDERVARQAQPLVWFSRLLPLMMALRGILGGRLWHNDEPRACMVIDDPLLRRRYGCLEYAPFFDSLKARGFSASIGFIPWNYRRSSRKTAALFAKAGAAASLCIHGCDHTAGEFASGSYRVLRGKAQLALDRMHLHRALSGVPFDDVMVFPQGRFSSDAVRAVSAAGYLAAVNGDVCPAGAASGPILRDLLEGAVTRFADFPLLGRRYPRELAEFAFDLFMGKPAIAAEHHRYLSDGGVRLGAFVDGLRALDPRIEWASLATICSRLSWQRTIAGGEILVRFFARRFALTNTGTAYRHCVLVRRVESGTPVPRVFVDGRPVACRQVAGTLQFDLTVAPGRTLGVAVTAPADSVPAWKATPVQSVHAGLRRLAGEVRDWYVARA